MPLERFEEVRALPLFSEISEASFSALMRGAYVQNFPPHTELVTEGDPADFLHVVASGWVELFSSWSDRETCMTLLRPYGTFILAATIKDRPYLLSARTLTKSRIIMIPSEDIRDVFDGDSVFAKSIVRELAISYRESIRHTKNIKLRTSVERLANYVVKHHAHAGGGGSFTLDVEKKKLASFLGMTPENLSRAFAALKNHGVEVSGSTILLSDPADLEAFARPYFLIDD
ncbi:MAG: cyclic nucleotide-binding domain-containing protein [Rhodobacteraceae bacterium]|nr:cyclic nucleotide-binding domain-containing protein [Paracoccaceae bacterium]